MAMKPLFRTIIVSAPSKLILHGEHAVVYGHSAIAGSLDLRTRMTLSPNEDSNRISVEFPDIDIRESWDLNVVKREILDKYPTKEETYRIDSQFLGIIRDFIDSADENLKVASLTCFFYLYAAVLSANGVVMPMKIKVESDIPVGAGLGSSAALSVCLASGLLSVTTTSSTSTSENVDDVLISNYALMCEQILHGTPSGIDSSVSTYGGLISFRAGEVFKLKLPEDVKLRVMLVNSKVPRMTKEVVDAVRLRFRKYCRVVRPIMKAIDGVVLEALDVFQQMISKGSDCKEDYETLADLIRYNQKLLETLGVSHPKLDEIVDIANGLNFHGAKLTGAGVGGFCFILLPPTVPESQIESLKDALKKRGYNPRETSVGVSGVKIQVSNT